LSKSIKSEVATPINEADNCDHLWGIILVYSNAISTYRETRVKTASQGQLVLMLYDEAIKSLDRGLELLELNTGGKKNPENIEKISKSILKTQEIITELTVSLDFEQGGEIAKNLFSLYTWFNKELLEANISQDVRRISSVRSQLNELRGAWAEIAAKSSSETAGKAVTGVNIAG
jgi:flagellar protein FliS